MAYLFVLLTSGMSMQTSTTFIGWSKDYRAAAFVQRENGPEGGGSFGLVIVTIPDGGKKYFGFSSDTSPGDGSTPQRVSQKQCEATAAKARQLLARAHFQKVTVNAAKCAGAPREDVVSGAEVESATVWQPWITPALQLPEITFRFTGHTLQGSVQESRTDVLAVASPDPTFLIYRGPKDTSLVIVVGGSEVEQPVVVFLKGTSLEKVLL
jgi:hypothetical protein